MPVYIEDSQSMPLTLRGRPIIGELKIIYGRRSKAPLTTYAAEITYTCMHRDPFIG